MSNRNKLTPRGMAVVVIFWILLLFFQCNGARNISDYMKAVREFRGF
jgi:hypothetical protein